LSQTGTGRIVQDSATTPIVATTNLVVTNGSATNATASMVTQSGDVIQLNASNDSGTVYNWGSMTSTNNPAGGAQVIDFSNVVTGSNVVYNYATGTMTSTAADAVRPGVNGIVNNWGLIKSIAGSSTSADGIDLQNNSGVTINGNAGTIEGARHGITGAQLTATTSYTLTVTNLAGATIQGDNGSGINIDGVNGLEVVTVINGGLIVGNGVTGDGDGVDVDGLVKITNTGIIRSANAVDPAAAFSEGITVGGGTITNSGTIEGLVAAGNTNAKGIGITLTGNDVAGSTTGEREGLYGNAVVVNQTGGLIRGQNSSAIVAKGDSTNGLYTVSISNDATSVIRGGGTIDAAIQLGADSATINDSGLIDGSSSGIAIAGAAGSLTINITGGQASVLGNIVGGTGTNAMKIDAGSGNSFAYSSGISNFSTVEVAGGTVTLSGVNTYTGTTTIDAGARLVLDGAGRLAAASSLNLAGGTLALLHESGANAQEFFSLSLTGNSAIDLAGSSLTLDGLGVVAAGKTLTVLDYLASTSPTYALRFFSDLTGSADFLALMSATTIDGYAVSYSFDGAYTDVTAAVPEPANVALLLAGLGLLGAAKRRRQKAMRA
jgi:hypothetical protein